ERWGSGYVFGYRCQMKRACDYRKPLMFLARPAGFEPTTPWFVARYSIQLSYGRKTMILTRYRRSSPWAAAGVAVPAGRTGDVRWILRFRPHPFTPHATPTNTP